MIETLESLACVHGVRMVALITPDGVPVAVPGADAGDRAGTGDVDAIAAVATQWMDEVGRTLGALTWPAPEHLVVTAARGNLVLMRSPGSVLVALTDTTIDQAELRLQMEGAAARIGRSLRSLGDRASLNRAPAALPQPPAHEIDPSTQG
ncbi:MAG: roadblock/LC7 domain-containing protein [Planctomycetota bacterium]|jgi:predicted regulator of Ras-like GTPase activity (Roadblock/LC7/MglB family)